MFVSRVRVGKQLADPPSVARPFVLRVALADQSPRAAATDAVPGGGWGCGDFGP